MAVSGSYTTKDDKAPKEHVADDKHVTVGNYDKDCMTTAKTLPSNTNHEDNASDSGTDSGATSTAGSCATDFTVGSLVEAHSLSSKVLNGLQGMVTGRQGDRIQVSFQQPHGGKALKPTNLRIIKQRVQVPYWIADYVRRGLQSRSLDKVMKDFLDTYALAEEQEDEYIPQIRTVARFLGFTSV